MVINTVIKEIRNTINHKMDPTFNNLSAETLISVKLINSRNSSTIVFRFMSLNPSYKEYPKTDTEIKGKRICTSTLIIKRVDYKEK